MKVTESDIQEYEQTAHEHIAGAAAALLVAEAHLDRARVCTEMAGGHGFALTLAEVRDRATWARRDCKRWVEQ